MTDTTTEALAKLEKEIERIAALNPDVNPSEATTRQVAINPVLDALGWDTRDSDEVALEHYIGTGQKQIDYCLRHRRRGRVLIEAKRMGTNLDEHQEQLMQYAFGEESPLAALTDGLEWWLYVPNASGHWQERRFAQIDMKGPNRRAAAESLYRFLSRERVTSNAAEEEARKEIERQKRERMTNAALYEAWDRVLKAEGRNEMLLDLVEEEVQEISGHRPSRMSVREFLDDLRSATPPPPVAPKVTPPATHRRRRAGRTTPPSPVAPKATANRSRARNKQKGPTADHVKPVAFRLDGERHEVRSWSQVLTKVCELMARRAGKNFEKAVSTLPGRNFGTSGKRLKQGGALRSPSPVPGTRLYVEKHGNRQTVEKRAREVLRTVRGSDDGFEVETESPTRNG